MAPLAAWHGHGGVDARSNGGSLTLRYVIDMSQQAVLRPRQPFDDRRLPVVASPDVAASAGAGGALELSFGGQVVHARLVAVANRFPTTQDSGDSFVVADEASLASALGADDLPSAIPDELWLSAPPAPSSASRPRSQAALLRARRLLARRRPQRSAERSDRARHRLLARRGRDRGARARAARRRARDARLPAGRGRQPVRPRVAGRRPARAARLRALARPRARTARGGRRRRSRNRAGRGHGTAAGRRRHARGTGSAAPAHHALDHDRRRRRPARAGRGRAGGGSLRVAYRRGAAGRGVTGEQWAE